MSSYLEKLKSCTSISDLISEFQMKISPRQFGYIVYGLSDAEKYQCFTIPKKSGGDRIIQSPNSSLKEIQRKIADILMHCISEIKKKNHNYLRCNHAFECNKSIVSNAEIHRNKKFILNIDIKDFFDSIHYGRIKGFFVSDSYFSLNENVARIIAKSATCNGFLPQGSPLSPVISSLIGNLIDVRFLKLAKKYRFSYSRYADDITLSSNEDLSPSLIYWDELNNVWKITNVIDSLIKESGFKINHKKTRYNRYSSRQIVTGIVVNRKRNVTSEYRRENRAMVHSLLQTGKFYISNITGEKVEGSINQLIGRINHCIYVKYYYPKFHLELDQDVRNKHKKDKRDELIQLISSSYMKKGDLSSFSDHQMYLLRSTLFYKYFLGISETTIYPEGHTDDVYFKLAARKLNITNIKIKRINNSLRKLGLTGGTPKIYNFLNTLLRAQEKGFLNYGNINIKAEKPAIFILDYDDGLDSLSNFFSKINDNKSFYNVKDNIYLLLIRNKIKKISKKESYKESNNQLCIENLLNYNGKRIEVSKDNKEKVIFNGNNMSKSIFSMYVSKNQDIFDFSQFQSLFHQISLIEDDYKKLIKKVAIQ
ncbi:retron Ec67 family RNA-directed DNA polymerase/endonuclease [Lonepinella sp. MS14437]|uniref:retron Ec67 family RNA-directed DNA polymerase/endonuclease n=1 Tax=Lonepinella sp. MS14437 TaxID=3003620 RepID=UPI0036DD340F